MAGNELAGRELDSPESEANDKPSRIAELAYFKAQARGYESGHDMQD